MEDTKMAAAAVAVKTEKKENKKSKPKHGCLFWFLIICAVILAIIGLLVALFFRVPKRLGIVKSPAEKYLSGTPNRQAAADLLAELEHKGISTTGMELYVIPYDNGADNFALAVLDSAQGFTFTQLGGLNPLADLMLSFAGSPTVARENITRLSVDYRDEAGENLATLTAPMAQIEAFSKQTISQQEFIEALEGDMNYPRILQSQIEELQSLSQ